MQLRNKIKVLGEYAGKSKFEFFKNLQEGDVLTLTVDITRAHTKGYASSIHIVNTRSDEKFIVTFSECIGYFNKIKHEEYQEKQNTFTS